MTNRPVLGLIEEVFLKSDNYQSKIIARIDSGATSSSVDSLLVKQLSLGPILRSKIVKSASGVKERPVIKTTIKISGKIIESEFNVADRSHMTYQMLIGQNILKQGQFLIDPLLGTES